MKNIIITGGSDGFGKTNFCIGANDKLPDEIMCLWLELERVSKM